MDVVGYRGSTVYTSGYRLLGVWRGVCMYVRVAMDDSGDVWRGVCMCACVDVCVYMSAGD